MRFMMLIIEKLDVTVTEHLSAVFGIAIFWVEFFD